MMGRGIGSGHAAVAAMVLALASSAPGRGVADDVGLTDLIARLGAANTPTGSGIVVAQVEALESGNYRPDPAHPEFAGKSISPQSGASGNSGHATFVGQNFYGNSTSIAPGITNIHVYSAGGWLQGNYLLTDTTMPYHNGPAPAATPFGIKLINNSWVGTFGVTGPDNDALRRADFVVNRDELLIVSGVNNGGAQQPMMCHTFNGISVGLWNGAHTSGVTVAPYDGPGRMKPEIVAPHGATSFATPIVNAAAALLVEVATETSSLAGANPNAARAIAIKAMLLAGGNHRSSWTNNPATSGPTRGTTATPLDSVYGVDMVNINRSHLILTGEEQDGSTAVPSAVNIIRRGWDVVTIPGADSRYYRFRIGAPADEVSILATWNRISLPSFSTWSVANFTLRLWRVDGKGLATLVGDPGLPYFSAGNVVSQSAVDNVEHLFIRDLQPGNYVIELDRVDGLGGNWDAAIAWLLPKRTGDLDEDGTVNVEDLLGVIAAWGACPTPCPPTCPADINGNCVVNVQDLLMVIANWG